MSELDIVLQELRAMRQEIQELKALQTLQAPPVVLPDDTADRRKIVPLKEAWMLLGYTSYTQCWRKIGKDRLYRPGTEAIDRRNPRETSPDWWLHLDKCREREQAIAAKRKVG